MARMSNVRWTVCAMLFVATTINYMDRQVIGILKPTLQSSMGMSETDYGNIIAAFQVAYAIGLLIAGRIIDRIGSRIGYTLVMGVWSAAAMSHALVTTVFGFGAARVFLGIGEAGNFPAAVKSVADWFPKRERSLATGIFNSGATAGAIVAPFVVPWITVRYGWHAAFFITGLAGIPWMVWWAIKYRTPAQHATVSRAEIDYIAEDQPVVDKAPREPWGKLLTYRQTWGIALAKGLTDPIWYFYLFWLPGFLETRFHIGLTHMGAPLMLIYGMSAVGSIVGGWLPNLFERFGQHGYRARFGAMFICALGSLPMLFADGVQREWLAIALLGLAVAAHQGWSANMFTIASDVFPNSAVGSITGIAAMVGSVNATLLSIGAGHVLQFSHSYKPLFILAGSVYLIGFACLVLLAPKLKRVQLREEVL